MQGSAQTSLSSPFCLSSPSFSPAARLCSNNTSELSILSPCQALTFAYIVHSVKMVPFPHLTLLWIIHTHPVRFRSGELSPGSPPWVLRLLLPRVLQCLYTWDTWCNKNNKDFQARLTWGLWTRYFQFWASALGMIILFNSWGYWKDYLIYL